jgi:hypothetical protein
MLTMPSNLGLFNEPWTGDVAVRWLCVRAVDGLRFLILDRRAQFGARRANDLYCKYLLDRRAKVHVSLMVRIHRW